MELIDSPVLGKKFTWFKPDGSARSRIDRFLLTEGVLREWKVAGQWVGDRDISDHCPVWVKCPMDNWGPKPFRFNNCWREHRDFMPFVEDCWKSFNVQGKKAFVLKEKLKLLKEQLKQWNREVFGWIWIWILMKMSTN
jgi:hypothetical protein